MGKGKVGIDAEFSVTPKKGKNVKEKIKVKLFQDGPS